MLISKADGLLNKVNQQVAQQKQHTNVNMKIHAAKRKEDEKKKKREAMV